MRKTLMKVTQDNRLVRASYYLTITEKRLVLLAIGKAQKGKFTGLTVSVEEYREMFGDKTHAFRNLKEATKTLYERSIARLEGRDSLTRWVSEVVFLKDEDAIKINFAPEIWGYLFDLKSCFTSLHLEKIKALKSSYSIRLYELLMQYKSTGELYITLEDLKTAFGLQGKYATYSAFKQRVLAPALRELKEKSNITLEMKTNKKRQKVTSFCFFFEQKKQGEFKF